MYIFSNTSVSPVTQAKMKKKETSWWHPDISTRSSFPHMTWYVEILASYWFRTCCYFHHWHLSTLHDTCCIGWTDCCEGGTWLQTAPTWSKHHQALISADPTPTAFSPALRSADPAGGKEMVKCGTQTSVCVDSDEDGGPGYLVSQQIILEFLHISQFFWECILEEKPLNHPNKSVTDLYIMNQINTVLVWPIRQHGDQVYVSYTAVNHQGGV